MGRDRPSDPSHGQLHVALSRTMSSRNIRVLLPDDQEGARTTNVVYPEVLAGVSGFQNKSLASTGGAAQLYFRHMQN